jgi:hypothetical protein
MLQWQKNSGHELGCDEISIQTTVVATTYIVTDKQIKRHTSVQSC